MGIVDYGTTGNSSIGGVSVATGMSPASVDNALRNIIDETVAHVSTSVAAEAALARNASNLNAGTVPDAQMPSARQAFGQIFTGDCNSINASGNYFIWDTATNGAVATTFAYLTAFVRDANNQIQIWQQHNTLVSYVRRKLSGTWGGWSQTLRTVAEHDARYAQLSGATFTGNVEVNGGTIGVKALVANNANAYWRDEIGNPKFVAYWDRAAQKFILNYWGDTNDLNFTHADLTWRIGSNAIHHDGNASRGAPDAVLEDQKAQNTAAQTVTGNTWTTRHLNTEVRDPSGLVTLSSNQFTVSENCWCEWSTLVLGTGATRLFNVTDGVVVANGRNFALNTYAESGGGGELIAGKTYRIEYYSSSAATGSALNLAGRAEVYTTVVIGRR